MKALLSTNDTDVTIRTEETQAALAEQLDSLSVVTSYSHSLTNIHINPVTSPPETWYTTLNENLGIARGHGQTWLTDIAPKVGSTIPQSLINYNNTFNAVAEEILRILGDKQVLSQSEKNDIIALIEATLDVLNDERSQIAAVDTKIKTLADDFLADHGRLVTGQTGAAAAVQLAKAEQLRIETKIRELQSKLDTARAKVTAAGIGLGLAIFVAVAAFALAVATGGAGLAVVGAVGVIGVGVAATFTGIFNTEISGLVNEIAERQTALSNTKRQVAALSGLVDTVSTLKAKNEDAKRALGNVQTMWQTLADKLDAVIKDLKGNKVDALVAVQRMNLRKARTAWSQTAEFAQKVQDLASGTHVQPVLQHSALHLAYAA